MIYRFFVCCIFLICAVKSDAQEFHLDNNGEIKQIFKPIQSNWKALNQNEAFNFLTNAGFENITIKRLAELISEMTGARVVFEASNDLRSYRVDSTRILEAGFSPKRSIRDAIIEIRDAYRSKLLKDMDVCYNVNWMRGLMAQGSILK